MRKMFPDQLVLKLYHVWSEETAVVSSRDPTSDAIQEFCEWMDDLIHRAIHPRDYHEILREYRRQERDAPEEKKED